MRLLNITLGSAICALALITSPLQAKEKSGSAPAACRCKPDSCKCEKKGVCKCPEATCTCEKCKAVREKQPAPNSPAAPAAPDAKPAANANPSPLACDGDDDDDDDDDKDACLNPGTLSNDCGKCDKKKDGDQPETCPDKAPCCPAKESAAAGWITSEGEKPDGDQPETCPDKAPCCPAKE